MSPNDLTQHFVLNPFEQTELLRDGTYPARIVGIVDMGTHMQTYAGVAKPRKIIHFTWEIYDETPHYLGKEYTKSLSSKSKLTALLHSLLGSDLPKSFNLLECLSKQCLVAVSVHETNSGVAYNRIDGVQRPMKGIVFPPAVSDMFYWTVHSLNSAATNIQFPDWYPTYYGVPIAEKIKESEEYKALPPF